MEELTCNIAINIEPDWNTKISEVKKKFEFLIEEKKNGFTEIAGKTLGAVLFLTKFHL